MKACCYASPVSIVHLSVRIFFYTVMISACFVIVTPVMTVADIPRPAAFGARKIHAPCPAAHFFKQLIGEIGIFLVFFHYFILRYLLEIFYTNIYEAGKKMLHL